MTDNRTTELLCKLLEERGIEWKDGDAAYEIEWSTPDGRHCSAMYWKPTFTVLISGCTPEQAIGATLGRPTFDANLEQALSFMRIWISDDAHLGESELSAVFEKAEGLRKLDAIESAIAATLGGGKLTAEQVREAVEGHGNIMDNRLYENWQAVADELNAKLGSERERALEELVRDAYWLIVRAIWSHESQDKFAAGWTERVSVLGIEVD